MSKKESKRPNPSRRGFLKAAGATVALGTAGTVAAGASFRFFPDAQSKKNRIMERLGLDALYDNDFETPTTQVGSTDVPAVERSELANERESIEDRIAELLITKNNNMGDHIPGGVLLTRDDTRRGILFGRYHSYDAARTQRKVEAVLSRARRSNQRILIHDEGEGGYVPRAGVLPTALNIGSYFEDNIVSEDLARFVTPDDSRNARERQITRMFDNYAQELHDRGVDVVLGPVVDVSRIQGEPHNFMRSQERVFSNHHLITRPVAMLYCDAMHRKGIRTTGKHFLTSGLPREGDSHDDLITNRISRGNTPLRWAMNTYHTMRNHFDSVMVSHVINPFDDLPYSISPRSIRALTEAEYEPGLYGVEFQGLVMIDDLSMEGLRMYVRDMELNERQTALLEGAQTQEARAAVLAIDAGAHTVIAVKTEHEGTNDMVQSIARAYERDEAFRERIHTAFERYEHFASNRPE